MALNWLVWELTGSAFDIGLVNLSRYLPLVIFSILGGVAADRFDKRKLLILTQIWSLLSYAAMAVLVQSNFILAWHIYVISALLGIGKALEDHRQMFLRAGVTPDKEVITYCEHGTR